MRVEVVTDEAGLRALADEWDGVLEEHAGDRVFLSAAWAEAWWGGCGEPCGTRLHVVCLRDEDGRLAGLAPLYLTRDGVLRLVGDDGEGRPCYLNVIARAGRERDVAVALADHLARRRSGGGAVLLGNLAEGAPMTEALAGALAGRRGLLVRRIPGATCPGITLAHSLEAHQATMSHRQRRMARARRKLERRHQVRCIPWHAERPVTDGLALLAGLRGGRASAATIPRAAARLSERGRLRLYGLEVDGQVVAMLCGVREGRSVYFLEAGSDPGWAHAAVDEVLLSCALEHAIAEGARRGELLMGGDATDLTTEGRCTIGLSAVPRSLPGLARLVRAVYAPQLGALAAALRAPDLRGRLRGALGGRALAGHATSAAATALYRSGLMRAGLRLLRMLDGDRRLVILAYDGVRPPDAPRRDRAAVGLDRLESQLEVLASLFRPIAAADVAATLTLRPDRSAPYPVLVTCDGGRTTVLRHVQPRLRRHGLPLLLFVAPGAAGTDGFLWPDEVRELVAGTSRTELRVRFRRSDELHKLGSLEERLEVAAMLTELLMGLDRREFVQLLGHIRAAAGQEHLQHHEGTRLLDWDEIRALARGGVCIGSHGYGHLPLAQLPDDLLAAEIGGGQIELERELGERARCFAYAGDDVEERVFAAVAAAGFACAFTRNPGIASSRHHHLRLPRIAPGDVPGAVLGLQLLRLLAREAIPAWLARVRGNGVARAVASVAASPDQAVVEPRSRPSRPAEAPAPRAKEGAQASPALSAAH